MKSDLIDPEELPFTSDEIYRAGCRFLPEAAARGMAAALVDAGPGLIAARIERRAGWKKGGIVNADELPLQGWVYPDQLLSALSSLSPDLVKRVADLRHRLQTRPVYGGAA
jgi:hypothetical protein